MWDVAPANDPNETKFCGFYRKRTDHHSNDISAVSPIQLDSEMIEIENLAVAFKMVGKALDKLAEQLKKALSGFIRALKRGNPRDGWREVDGFSHVAQMPRITSPDRRLSLRENIGCWNFQRSTR